MADIIVPAVAILSVFVGTPCVVFAFINSYQKRQHEIKKLEYQSKVLELEIEQQNNKLKLLEIENKNLDKIIYEQ